MNCRSACAKRLLCVIRRLVQAPLQLATLLFIACVSSSLAYGPLGHEIVGAIADRKLAGTPTAEKIKVLVDGISLDTAVSMDWAVLNLGEKAALQGNLDPLVLVAGGEAMRNAIGRLLEVTRETSFVANLGHGVLPDTPVEHVAEFVRCVRSMR